MKVCFETFGCRLNKAEALQMEADYLADGWEATDRHADADLFVVRGCSVTSRAQHECEKLIDHLKRHYPKAQLKVCGCLANTSKLSTSRLRNPTTSQSLPFRTARAYLKVQDGCAGECTFCIVPRFRGKSKSESFAVLLDKAKRFIDTGYHEIVVTGCNLSLYASEGKTLPDLISALAELDTACRIRLGSLEPGDRTLETIHAMSEHPNVCRFLHLTVQSGSELILKSMRRPYSAHDIDRVALTAAKLMPNLGLGCDLMTGFPGETELDHAATRGLLKRLPFNNAHVFPYSSRPGTPAAEFRDHVPKEIRSFRAHELSNIAQTKRLSFARTFIGKTVEIVVEDEKTGRGWSSEYLTCEPVTGTPRRKSLIRLFVTKTKDDFLYGRPTR